MIVLDASVVLKLLTEEPGSDAALARVSREPDRVAPDWVHVEIAAALSKKVRYAGLPIEAAREYMKAVPLVMTEIADTASLLDVALDLSVALQHALYDCVYMAMAIEERCTVLTADRKFYHAAERGGLGQHLELLQ